MGVRERKEREREQRKQEILSSARKVFATLGLEHTSMERIASEAELSKGTLYLYYKNRDELILGLIGEELDELNKVLAKVVARKESADKKMLHCVSAFYKFSMEHQVMYRAMTQLNVRELMNCSEGEGSEAQLNFQRANNELFEMMKSVVQEGVDAGVYHLEHSVEYIVIQMILSLKGTLVVIQNGMAPPHWLKKDTLTMLQDNTKLFIKGMMSK